MKEIPELIEEEGIRLLERDLLDFVSIEQVLFITIATCTSFWDRREQTNTALPSTAEYQV